MDSETFTASLRRLVDRGCGDGAVNLDDLEEEMGDVSEVVFGDMVDALGSAGVSVGSDEDDEVAGSRRRRSRAPKGSRPPLFAKVPVGTGFGATVSVLSSRQIYYRDAGAAPLLTREREIALANRRLLLQARRGRVLSRTLPVAALFLSRLEAVENGHIQATDVLLDPPRPTAAVGPPPRPVSDRAAEVWAAYDLLAELLAHEWKRFGSVNPWRLARARVVLSRAVVRARPVPEFWDDAGRKIDEVIGRIALLRDRALVDDVARHRRGRGVRWSAGRASMAVPVECDDHDVLAAVRKSSRRLVKCVHKLRHQFAEANLRLVSGVARKYWDRHRGTDLADLEQSGNIGLLKAVDRFDPTRGFKFCTYATWWIKQSISRFHLDNCTDIRLPVHLYELTVRIRATEQRLRSETRAPVSDLQIAQEIGKDIDEVRRVRRAPTRTVSLETQVGPDTGGAEQVLGHRVPDPDAIDPEDACYQAAFGAACRRILAELLSPDEERAVRKSLGMLPRVALGEDPPERTRAAERKLVRSAFAKLRVDAKARRLLGPYLRDGAAARRAVAAEAGAGADSALGESA